MKLSSYKALCVNFFTSCFHIIVYYRLYFCEISYQQDCYEFVSMHRLLQNL